MLIKKDVIKINGNDTTLDVSSFIRIFRRKMIVTFNTALNGFPFSKEYLIKDTFDGEYHEFLTEFKENYRVYLLAVNKLKNKGFSEPIEVNE